MNRLQRLPALSLLAVGLLASNAHAQVVISQVYGGGGNSGAPYTHDYVELFNRGETSASLAGRSVQYASATGSGAFGSSASVSVALPAVTLQPGQFFLIKLAGGTTGAALPAADATGNINMSGSAGKVALVEGTASLGCNGGNLPCSAEQAARLLDLVGWGNANYFEGTAAAPGTSNSTAATRKGDGCTDSNQNGNDFVAAAAAPHSLASAAKSCVALPPPPPSAQAARISEIQGNGLGSPIVLGTRIVTEGVVTALRGNGYFIQSAPSDEDSDPTTAEGVFVFTGSSPKPAAVAIGNRVRVTAKIGSFQRTPHGYPLTQLTSSSVELLATDQDLPAAVLLDTSALNAANGPGYLGRYQGMRIELPVATVVNPSNDYGDFFVTLPTTPRPVREPGIGALDAVPLPADKRIARFDLNPEHLRVESTGLDGGSPLFVDNGARIDGMAGVMYYDRANFTLLLGNHDRLLLSGGALPEPVSVARRGALRIGSYNVEFFGGGENVPTTRLDKLSDVFCNYLRLPDIVGLIEVADLVTLQRLARAINNDEFGHCPSNPHYQAYLLSSNGTQRVGYLVSQAASAGGQPRVEVLDVAEQFAGERLIAPDGSDSGLLFDRAPLQLDAVVHADNGERYPLTVLLNHTLSLLEVNSLTARRDSWGNDGNRSRAKRAAQAVKISQWVEAQQGADDNRKLVLIGDFNAFDFNDGYVDVMGIISGREASANAVLLAADSAVSQALTNLSRTGPKDERYSYVFEGNIQSLDHALVNDAVLASGEVSLQHARLNADFAVDHADDASVPMRTSDHDPLVAEIRVPAFLNADLQVALAGPSDPVFAGQRIQLPLTLANAGQDEAVQTELDLYYGLRPSAFSVSAVGWVCGTPVAQGEGSTVACERKAALAAGSREVVTAEIVTARPHNSTDVPVRAVVRSRSHEATEGDNEAAIEIHQVPAPAK